MYRCACTGVQYLLLSRWGSECMFVCVVSWPALQCVDPGIKWKAVWSLLLRLHTLRQDTLNGQEIMFDPAAGQRGCQLDFKPSYNTYKKKDGFFFLFFFTTSVLLPQFVLPFIITFQVWDLSSFFVLVIFLSLPEEVLLHISNFLYDLLLPLVFPWEELSLLEVIQHDSNKAHLMIWLEHKNKKYS